MPPEDPPPEYVEPYSDNVSLYSDLDETRHTPRLVDRPPPYEAQRRKSRCLTIVLNLIIVILILMIVRISYISLPSKGGDHGPPEPKPTKPKGPNEGKLKKPDSFNLDFAALYPDIQRRKDSKCQSAWEELDSVRCHEKLFDRGSDNGQFRLLGFDPMYFLPRLCDTRCEDSLTWSLSRLQRDCSPEDTFDLTNYDGMFKTDLLEKGPLAVVETLMRRRSHMCRASPLKDSDFEFCPTEMHYRFGVNDGMNPNTQGIKAFVSDTNDKRTEAAQWHRGTRGGSSGGSRYSYRYNYRTRRQSYGPGRGETSCSWCVFDFLNHTLSGWTEGSIPSADGDQNSMTLAEFINRVRVAGKRCSPSAQWEELFANAVKRYQQQGLLPEDWETSLPSGGMDFLIRNGPSTADPPVSDIGKELDNLKEEGYVSVSEKCLLALKTQYTSAGCYINIPQKQLVAMLEPDHPLQRSLTPFCRKSCSEAIDHWAREGVCKKAESRLTRKTRQLYNDYNEAKALRTTYCGIANDPWRPVSPCVEALKHMDRLSWVVSGRPESPELIEQVKKGLDEVEKDHADLIRDGIDDMPRKEKQELEKKIEQSICSKCFWTWLIGTDTDHAVSYLESALSADDYASTVDRHYTTCSALGAKWVGDAPFGDDPVVWRIKQQNGRVIRYIDVEAINRWDDNATYGGDEESGGVHMFVQGRHERPGIDFLTLWHFRLAHREFKNSGRTAEWQKEEELHRKEADSKVWKITERGVSFVGGKQGKN